MHHLIICLAFLHLPLVFLEGYSGKRRKTLIELSFYIFYFSRWISKVFLTIGKKPKANLFCGIGWDLAFSSYSYLPTS